MTKKSGRTRLEKLQNSWRKASDAERRQFLEWISGADADGSSLSRIEEDGIPIASGRYLTPQTIERIRAVMKRRSLTLGDLLQEIGLPPEDRSLARALARNSSLRLAVVEALRDWLVEHSDKEP
ncbi:hypothetical protein M8R20_01045 [Pseudomonas sp. R2.Fl]|nr:hypothetical protein [Pseudomonas sp. R2.Fl]